MEEKERLYIYIYIIPELWSGSLPSRPAVAFAFAYSHGLHGDGFEQEGKADCWLKVVG